MPVKLIMVKGASGGYVFVHESVAASFEYLEGEEARPSQIVEMAEMERKMYPPIKVRHTMKYEMEEVDVPSSPSEEVGDQPPVGIGEDNLHSGGSDARPCGCPRIQIQALPVRESVVLQVPLDNPLPVPLQSAVCG